MRQIADDNQRFIFNFQSHPRIEFSYTSPTGRGAGSPSRCCDDGSCIPPRGPTTLRFTVSRSTFFFGSGARLQLYQRRFLRPISHFSAFSEIHIFSFAPFRISVIFQSLRTQIRKNRRPFYREAESITDRVLKTTNFSDPIRGSSSVAFTPIFATK